MTVQQAIEILEVNAICSPKATKFKGAVEVVKQALEKQIPKKPIDDRYPWSICPVCGGSINCEEVQEYIHNKECSFCVHCGQKIDWSDTE